MSTRIQNESTTFIAPAYRELLVMKKKSALVHEIRLLAQQQGQWVALFRRPPAKMEAVFSKESGFLLGETVWYYFGRLRDLIFCECSPEQDGQVLIVVVRSGFVYLDTRMPVSQLAEELAPLITGEHHYKIVIYGEVPISRQPEAGKFHFPPEYVSSFEILDEPLFPRLLPPAELQLQPLDVALRKERLIQHPSLIGFSVLFSLGLIASWTWYQRKLEHYSSPPSRVASAPTDQYGLYRAALMTAPPREQLKKVVQDYNEAGAVLGWGAHRLSFDGQSLVLHFDPEGGSLQSFVEWARAHQWTVDWNPTAVTLQTPIHLPQRAAPAVIYALDQVLIRLIDQLNVVLPKHTLSLGPSQSKQGVKERALLLSVSDISPAVLDLIGGQLQNFPVELVSVDLDLTQGLASGTIKLNVWGL